VKHTTALALTLLLAALPLDAAWGGPPDGAALACELARFPPPCVTAAYAELAQDHWKWVVANAPLNADRTFWHNYQRQAALRASAWGHLHWAHRCTTAFNRWCYLDMLSQILGDELYAEGWMPTPMPCLDDIWSMGR
jgi:hypothetical protein